MKKRMLVIAAAVATSMMMASPVMADPAVKNFRQIALSATFYIRPSLCASLVHSLKIPSNGGMRSSAWVTPSCPRLLKTFKICAQKKDLRSILPFDYTID